MEQKNSKKKKLNLNIIWSQLPAICPSKGSPPTFGNSYGKCCIHKIFTNLNLPLILIRILELKLVSLSLKKKQNHFLCLFQSPQNVVILGRGKKNHWTVSGAVAVQVHTETKAHCHFSLLPLHGYRTMLPLHLCSSPTSPARKHHVC